MPRAVRRIACFVALWALGVGVLATIGGAIKILLN